MESDSAGYDGTMCAEDIVERRMISDVWGDVCCVASSEVSSYESKALS